MIFWMMTVKSALGKINSVIETFDTRMEKLLKEAQIYRLVH